MAEAGLHVVGSIVRIGAGQGRGLGVVRFNCCDCGTDVTIVGLEETPEPPRCDVCHLATVRLIVEVTEGGLRPLRDVIECVMVRFTE